MTRDTTSVLNVTEMVERPYAYGSEVFIYLEFHLCVSSRVLGMFTKKITNRHKAQCRETERHLNANRNANGRDAEGRRNVRKRKVVFLVDPVWLLPVDSPARVSPCHNVPHGFRFHVAGVDEGGD